MVEMEIRQSKPETETVTTTNIDINQIIGKIREFIESIRGMSGDGKPMTVRVDSFNFAVDKDKEEYTVTFRSKLAITPKEEAAT